MLVKQLQSSLSSQIKTFRTRVTYTNEQTFLNGH